MGLAMPLAAAGFYGSKEKKKFKNASRKAANTTVRKLKKLKRKSPEEIARALRPFSHGGGTASKGSGPSNPSASKLSTPIEWKAPKFFK